jgi:hypothetical protein
MSGFSVSPVHPGSCVAFDEIEIPIQNSIEPSRAPAAYAVANQG